MSRPGGRSNGVIRGIRGEGSPVEQSTSGNRKGVSPTKEVEEFKVSRDGAINNAKIRNPVPVDRQPIARN